MSLPILFLSGLSSTARGQDLDQDSSLNNLVHPEGYDTAPKANWAVSNGEATWTRAAVDGVAGVIEDRGLQSPIVPGHFYQGGHVAFRLAVRHPGLIGGAIVVGSEATRLPAD